jgi:signal transduction histidine kinase
MQTAYILLCFPAPAFCMGLPLAVYDFPLQKRRALYLPALLAAICACPSLKAGETAFVFAGIIASLTLSYKTLRLAQTEQRLIETRDNSAELTALLKDKNRRLMESQDNEIYTATLRERNRIAREIHDNVGHLLTRCLLQIGALIAVTADNEQKEQLCSVRNSLDGAMTSVRQSVHDLHDDSINLENTVREIGKSIGRKFALRIECDCSDSMPKNIKLAFIGIIKEALNNTAKYSSGDSASVTVQEFPAFYRLIVFDNGENECESDIAGKGSGIGLLNMRDRVTGLGGIIRIDSSREGFKVFVTVPKPKELCTA